MNVVKYLTIALLLAALSGCASYPISKQFRQQAQIITLDQAKADPQGTHGRIVIWGGRIISVTNNPRGGSIYILCLPAGDDEQPIPDAPSPGRFIATSTGFLDPEMFPQGNLITVAGQLDGIRTEQLQNVQYTYPVLDIQETHVWPREPAGYYYPYYGYYPPYWGWGWWGPGWWWWGGPYYYGGFYGGYHGGYRGGAVRGGAVSGGGAVRASGGFVGHTGGGGGGGGSHGR